MSEKKAYRIDDFKVGEYVIVKGEKEQRLVVISIDRERSIVICRPPTERSVQAYFPYELEKEESSKQI